MKVAFISYWGINDPLAVATVYPHVKILAEMPHVEEVYLISFERSDYTEVKLDAKIKCYFVQERNFPPGLNKFFSFRTAWKLLKSIHQQSNLDFTVCRSSFAGILGYQLKKKFNIPFLVESLEPHADYMISSGDWSKYGIKARVLKNYEKKIFAEADYLLPVSQSYREILIERGVDNDRIKVLPCTIDLEDFSFNDFHRSSLRKEWNVANKDIVGIYVGKFGGIYYEDQAFRLFRLLKERIEGFKLVVLTPDDKFKVGLLLESQGFQKSELVIEKVQPSEVPKYLSASDIGIAIYRESKFSKCLSPIKVGEYLINGLPVIMTKNIGDDSELIEQKNIGATFSFIKGELVLDLTKILLQLKKEDSREYISSLGLIHRSRDISINIYNEIFNR